MTECWASELWTRTTGTATIDFRNVTVEDEEFDHGHGFIADDDRELLAIPEDGTPFARSFVRLGKRYPGGFHGCVIGSWAKSS